MKKILIKFLLRLLCAKDVMFAESFELKAKYSKSNIVIKFSDDEIDKILATDESFREDIKDTRKKKKKILVRKKK